MEDNSDRVVHVLEVSLPYWKTIMEADTFLLLIKFYEKTKHNANEALKVCEAPIFKTYLVWRVKHLQIKKESSAITY